MKSDMEEMDRKTRWRNYRYDFFCDVITYYRDDESAELIKKYKAGLYESQKTYIEGAAYNDGTWIKYIHNDKIKCQHRDEIGRYLFGYLCFLLDVGVEDRDALIYFSVCFIIDRLEYKKGVFGCSAENKERIISTIDTVRRKRPKSVKTAKIDDRMFCLDPKMIEKCTKWMKKREAIAWKTKMQKKIQKRITDGRIAEFYDSKLSIRNNIAAFKDKGLKISKSRLQEWINEQKIV